MPQFRGEKVASLSVSLLYLYKRPVGYDTLVGIIRSIFYFHFISVTAKSTRFPIQAFHSAPSMIFRNVYCTLHRNGGTTKIWGVRNFVTEFTRSSRGNPTASFTRGHITCLPNTAVYSFAGHQFDRRLDITRSQLVVWSSEGERRNKE